MLRSVTAENSFNQKILLVLSELTSFSRYFLQLFMLSAIKNGHF
jgi:hypothetical protein